MMMRMLEAGGMPVLTDNIRQADADNPNGYYEFEPVKHLNRDTLWLIDAYGKAVKIIYRLLYNVPREHRYKVVMMNRHIAEVVASQDAMLRREGKGQAENTADVAKILESDFAKVQAWLQSQPNFELLNLDYNYVVRDAGGAVYEITRFLGYELDTQAMAEVPRLSLCRQRRP
jgi:hypothetical protein